MINTTDQLQFLVTRKTLHRKTVAALAKAAALIEHQLGRLPNLEDNGNFGFTRQLGSHNHAKQATFDEAFLKASFDFVQTDAQSTGSKRSIDVLRRYVQQWVLPATGFASLKRGLKLMLVEMWRERALLLPSTFRPGPYFPVHLFDHPLLQWLQTFDPEDSLDGSGKANNRRLRYYGPRLVWTADWQSPSEVRLQDIASLNRALVLYRQGKSATPIAGGSQLPLSLFAATLLRSHPHEVTFSLEDLARYSAWSQTHAIADIPFENYSAAKQTTRKHNRRERHRGPAKPRLRPELVTIGSEDIYGALLRNFKLLQRNRHDIVDWQGDELPVYPSREHIDLAGIAPLWIKTFKAYMHQRLHVKGYRTTRDVVAVLNLLADYLFFYLPWWREVSPETQVALPASPAKFSRFVFVSRHNDMPPEEMPATLLDMVAARRTTKESAAAAIRQLVDFFSFVEMHFNDDEEVAGRSFRNPLNMSFDAPRIKVKNKTNKEAIPRKIYGYLLFYCYAVEEFGMNLERLAINGRLTAGRDELRSVMRFDSEAYGLKPIVRYRGTEFPLSTIPNVFQWAEREVVESDTGLPRLVYIPHCTALRLLITSLETGLRCQSVQWLDKHSWKSLGDDTPPDSYTFPLLVNTDKTRTESWQTFVVYRVRDMLRRQEAFQAKFTDSEKYGPVDYEKLANSPFDPIQPLFRSAGSGYPVSDKTYAKVWRQLMADFELFYQSTTGQRHIRMIKLQPRLNVDDTPVVKANNHDGSALYCPISILAVHPPHACRVTFVTNRKGILELSDTAQLVGHRDEVVTAHYDKPSAEDLQARLQESDAELTQEFLQHESGSGVHVRADKQDSALVRSFSKDRTTTIRAFGFMPPITLWSTQDTNGEPEGLTLLQEGPMSHIRFRETHICPVGEECPADILEQIGAPRRCGCCPLAMKCIDHMTAIAAKQNQLHERIRYLQSRRDRLEAAGEPVTVLDEVWEEIELDVNELVGWQLSEKILLQMRKNTDDNGTLAFHVEQPELVRNHLERVTRSSSEVEFMLQRIVDSNAYPSMATSNVQLVARQIKRKLMAGRGADVFDLTHDDIGAISDVAGMLELMMKTKGVSMKQIAARLSTTPALADSALPKKGNRGE